MHRRWRHTECWCPIASISEEARQFCPILFYSSCKNVVFNMNVICVCLLAHMYVPYNSQAIHFSCGQFSMEQWKLCIAIAIPTKIYNSCDFFVNFEMKSNCENKIGLTKIVVWRLLLATSRWRKAEKVNCVACKLYSIESSVCMCVVYWIVIFNRWLAILSIFSEFRDSLTGNFTLFIHEMNIFLFSTLGLGMNFFYSLQRSACFTPLFH